MNTSAQQNVKPVKTQTAADAHIVGSATKEQGGAISSSETIRPASSEVAISPEMENVGVVAQKETVEIPPDLAHLGLTHAGPTAPVVTPQLQNVVLPITDKQVVVGLHMHIYTALRWLATWCVRRLKKAHIRLVNVQGTVIRKKM